LVPRLFDVTAGAVLIGGVDVRDLAPEVLWTGIGLIPQKPYLFSGTVASNLQYGKPDATEAEMWEALEVAQAADFVATMPGGLEDGQVVGVGTHRQLVETCPTYAEIVASQMSEEEAA